MKIKIGRGKILLIILAIVIVSVIFYYLFNPEKALKLILPGLNEISYIHIDLKKDSALVKLFVFVQNKMPYKMVIDTIHFEIKLNGLKMVEETVQVHIDQSWFDTDTIELPVRISLKETRKIIGDLHGQDSTDMNASFYVVYKTFIGNQKIHINKKIRIASPIPPRISILKLEHKKYNMKDKTSEAVLKIEIINDGKNIDLQLDSVCYNLQIKNTLFSKGIFAGPIDIKPVSSLTVDIPIIIEYSNPFKTVWAIVIDKDMMEYDLNVKTDVIVNNSETSSMIPIEVDATGFMELVK
jgi:LEA14-like dessication related protein